MSNTISDNLIALSTAKTNIANAITNKGVTVPYGSGLLDFPTLINSISGGSEVTEGSLSDLTIHTQAAGAVYQFAIDTSKTNQILYNDSFLYMKLSTDSSKFWARTQLNTPYYTDLIDIPYMNGKQITQVMFGTGINNSFNFTKTYSVVPSQNPTTACNMTFVFNYSAAAHIAMGYSDRSSVALRYYNNELHISLATGKYSSGGSSYTTHFYNLLLFMTFE